MRPTAGTAMCVKCPIDGPASKWSEGVFLRLTCYTRAGCGLPFSGMGRGMTNGIYWTSDEIHLFRRDSSAVELRRQCLGGAGGRSSPLDSGQIPGTGGGCTPPAAPDIAHQIRSHLQRPHPRAQVPHRRAGFRARNRHAVAGRSRVHLSAAAASFEVVLGVDSNDLGYYSNAGRGNVVASVEAGGREVFRSPVMHEGMPGIPLKVDLAGAAGFRLRLASAGERTRTYQAEWDQADWADACVRMMDGTTVWLAALSRGPLPGTYSTDPPFSFRYAGRASGELLRTWPAKRVTGRVDEHRTEYVTAYTDADTGLEVRSVAIGYDDFPIVEWTVYLRNGGTVPTPVIEDL